MREGRIIAECSGNNVLDDTNILPRMDRDTLRTNYRALVKALYEPKTYYDRVKILLTQLKAPKEKSPLTPGVLLAVLRCFFWLGLIRRCRFHFWRVFLWTCLHRRRSMPVFVRLALVGYHFGKVSEDFGAGRTAEPGTGRTPAPLPPPQPQLVSS
jgi:hypothetical protein